MFDQNSTETLTIEKINQYLEMIEPKPPILGDTSKPARYNQNIRFDSDGIGWESVRHFDGHVVIEWQSYEGLDGVLKRRKLFLK